MKDAVSGCYFDGWKHVAIHECRFESGIHLLPVALSFFTLTLNLMTETIQQKFLELEQTKKSYLIANKSWILWKQPAIVHCHITCKSCLKHGSTKRSRFANRFVEFGIASCPAITFLWHVAIVSYPSINTKGPSNAESPFLTPKSEIRNQNQSLLMLRAHVKSDLAAIHDLVMTDEQFIKRFAV